MLFAHIFTTLNRPMRRRACAWLLFPRRRSQRQTGPSQTQLKTRLIDYLLGEKKGDGRRKMKERRWEKEDERKEKEDERKSSIIHHPSSIISHPSSVSLHYNARSALYHGIQSLGIGIGDEIILQAYTCVSVPNAIISTGAKPIYCDIDANTLNINPGSIVSLITPNTKAVLVQHTFGTPADLQVIQKICADYHLALIEDCCHALGGTYQGQKLGTFGDIAIFSFGRDKIISSVNGGALVFYEKEDGIKEMGDEEKSSIIHHPSLITYHHPPFTILQNLLYIILGQICKKTYHLGIGKLLYYLAGKLHLFPTIVTKAEKECHYTDFNYTMPNCLADIALHELERVDEYNAIRNKNTNLYKKSFSGYGRVAGGLLRCVMLAQYPHQLSDFMKSKGIILGDRYQQVIAPKGTDYAAAGYVPGSCSIAESVASQSVNLPNHPEITNSDITKIIGILSKYKA